MLAALAFHAAVYHAACLAGSIACSHDVVARFWNERLAATAEDAARVDRWRAIFERVEKAAGPPEPTPLMPNYVGAVPALRLRSTILAAAFDSRDASEFERRASKLIARGDARELARIAVETERRLGTVASSPAPEMPKQFDRMREFLAARLHRRDLRVHVIPLPDGADSATTVGHHVLMERPTAAVLLHESVHALFETSSRHRELMSWFEGDTAQALYSNFNEALAMAAQLLVSPADTYRDPVITALGRALAPELEKHPALDREFVRAYIAAAKVDTRFMLSAVAVTGDAASRAVFVEMVAPRYRVESEDEAAQFAHLPLVRLVRMSPASLEVRHREGRLVITIVGPDDASVRRLIGELLARNLRGPD